MASPRAPHQPPTGLGSGGAKGGYVVSEGNDRCGQEGGGGCDDRPAVMAIWPFASGLLIGGDFGVISRNGRPRPRRRPLPYLSTLAANPRLLGGGGHGGRSKRRAPPSGEGGASDDDDDEEEGVDHDGFSVPLLEEARRRVAEGEEAVGSVGPTEEAAAAAAGSRRPQRATAGAVEGGGTAAVGSGDDDGEEESNLDASPDRDGGHSSGPTCPLDDPANSSLTRGQHERYLALRDVHVAGNLSLSSKSTPAAQRKRRRMWRDEFRTLRDSVVEERTRYAEALLDWRGKNADRFLVGFKVDVDGPASKFVNATSRHVESWRRRWNAVRRDGVSTPNRYGRCTQSISLPMPASGGTVGGGGRRGGVGSYVVALSGGGGGIGDHYEDDDVVIPDDADRRNDGDDEGDDLERGRRGVDLNDWVSTLVSTGEDSSKGDDDDSQRPKLPVIDGEIATSLRDVPLEPVGEGVDFDRRRSITGERMAEEESLLAEDGEALALAVRHGAEVVLPVEAFVALLQRPGGKMSRWKIPLSKVIVDESGAIVRRSGRSGRRHGSSSRSRGTVGAKEIVVMEHPVPQPSSPRECLTHGFEGPLYRALSTSKSKSRQACCHSQYVYSLLSIPSSSFSSGGGPLKVLVRLGNDLQDEEGCPIRRLVQLEYFPERGWERYTSHSRCLWALEKLLQPTARVLVGRVDPSRAVLLRVEERGVAHALSDRSCDPSQFFAIAAVVLHAVTKLRGGSHILCLPGCVGGGMTSTQAMSVSVHDACVDEEGDAEATVDIGRELINAESVFTNRAALLACFRMWEWDEDAQVGRVPYTFPLEKESEEAEHYTGSKPKRA